MPTMPSWVRRPSARQSNSHRPGNESPQPASYSGSPNQSTQRAPDSDRGWSPPSQSPAYSQAGYSQSGNSTQRGSGYSQHDNGAYPGPGGFRHQATLPVSNHPIAQTNSFSQHDSPPVVQEPQRDEARDWFVAIDQDGNGELSYRELHSALLNNGGTLFSTTTVKYLVSIFDVDGDGVIRMDEFRPLWDYLRGWWRMFESFDTDRDGRIDATELGRALGHYRIQVPPHILDRVVKKYSDPRHGGRPQMDLDQFVCASVVVRQMCNLYERCNAGGGSNVSRDEFLLAVIALP